VTGHDAEPSGQAGAGRELLGLGLLLVLGGVGMVCGLALLVLVVVGLLLSGASTSLDRFVGGVPGLGLLSGTSSAASSAAVSSIPPEQLTFMQQVAAASPCHLPWTVLAGVASVESGFGTNLGPSSAGAYGYGQFMPATWPAYGGGVPWRTTDPGELANPPAQRRDSSNFHFALPAMASFLCAMVAEFSFASSPDDALKRALFYYNHARTVRYDPSDAYVRDVLARAATYAGPSDVGSSSGASRGLVAGWADRPALNQYACANYRSVASCQLWAPAACSAASLDWLLEAYGVGLGGIDDAIALIGPGTGISTVVGLQDSSGTRLAAALGAEGLTPRRAQLRSTQELGAWVAHGPLLLDGHRWFGVGHWFVAIASDAGGVFIRDSSVWDTRYLGWARLYGEVGWSGWAVGVQSPEGGPSA
jgi:hypothetical protein